MPPGPARKTHESQTAKKTRQGALDSRLDRLDPFDPVGDGDGVLDGPKNAAVGLLCSSLHFVCDNAEKLQVCGKEEEEGEQEWVGCLLYASHTLAMTSEYVICPRFDITEPN